MSTGKDASGRRFLHERVKTARGRKASSTRWLQRQLNDPYVKRAQAEGYRSRAAYKLLELNDKFNILHAGQIVLDLGAAPGGWSQVAAEITGADAGKAAPIIGVDILPFSALPGVENLELDFMQDDAPERILALMSGKANIVLSDMAPNTTGHAPTDHIRIVSMCEAITDFALQVLAPGGHFVCKVRQGGAEREMLDMLRKNFHKVKHAKPAASRKESAEMYLVALDFHGAEEDTPTNS